MCAGNHRHPGDTDHDWERRMAEADERARAEDERERQIEKTPVAVLRPDPMHEQRIKAIAGVLRRGMPRELPRESWDLYEEWIGQLATECLAAAETAI